MRWRTLSAAVLSVVLVEVIGAGCTTTVSGHGQPASVSESVPKFAATTEEPTQSSSARPTTTAPRTTVAAPTRTTPTPITRAQLDRQLAGRTPGQRRVLVSVRGTFEAATYDQAGHVTFWRATSSWVRAGASTYPYDAAFQRPAAKLTGALLTGMTHATFIATGYFSGDGSGNAVAFTTGAKGWGAIKAEKNGNIGPSGRGVGYSAIGLANEFAFVGGLLMTADCSDVGPTADCGGLHRVIKYWRWAGSDFVLDHRAGLSH
jgi:hypothetical protein